MSCKRLTCLAGIAPPGSDIALFEETLVSNLKFAAAKLSEADVRLLLEPINTRDVPGYIVSTTSHASLILEAVGSDNLFLQYDFYHAQVMQGDLLETFRRLADGIAHVQIADNPGRHEPGTGEINFSNVFKMLDASGYNGFVGREFKPSLPTSESLSWMQYYLQKGHRT